MTAVSDDVKARRAPWRRLRAWPRLQALFLNPLLVRDARSLLRGRRPFLLQTGYLVLLIAALGLSAFFVRQERLARPAFGGPPELNYGQIMFLAMFETQATLLFLIVIAYSAGSIALEFEKRTFEMVSVTTLSSLEIVLGKVASITGLCWMLLMTSAPLAAICLLLGGISPGQIVLPYLLLAYSIITLSAAGVFFSTVAGRTISAFVVSLLCIGAWAFLTSMFSVGDPGAAVHLGLLSPFVAPVPDAPEFVRLFNHSLPAWIPPLIIHGLTAALCIVAAAEAIPLHRPRRSTVLRLLVLALTFVICFLYSASSLEHSRTSGGMAPSSYAGWQASHTAAVFAHPLWNSIAGWLVLAWLLSALVVPIWSTYSVPAEAEKRLRGWVLAAVPPWRWLRRDANVGWRAVLLLFATIFGAGLLPPVIASATGLIRGSVFTLDTVGLLAFAVLLLALSLFAYSVIGTGMSAAWRDRRIGAFCVVMVMMALNVIGVYHVTNSDGFRRLPFLAHPIFALPSPLSAAIAVMNPRDPGRYFQDAWSSPIYVVCLGFIYQVLILAGAFHILRKLEQRDHEAQEEQPAVAVASVGPHEGAGGNVDGG